MSITRDQADIFIKELKNSNKSSLFTIMIAGSYRRELPLLKDIDILMVSKKDEWDLTKTPSPIDTLKLPGQLIEFNNGIVHRLCTVRYDYEDKTHKFTKNIKCDIYAVDKRNLPFALIHSTGDRGLNLGLRRIAIDKGWLLNQYGLWYRNRPNVRVAGTENFKTEKQVFEKLGKHYKSPAERDHATDL